MHYRVGDRLYNMDPTTWPNVDVSSVQRELGCGLGKFIDRLEEGDADAVRALIWVLRRRDEHALKVDDVVFTFREYAAAIEQTDEDVIDTWYGLPPSKQTTLRESLDEEQRARLFDDRGMLKEEAEVPLDGTPVSET